MLWEQHNFCTEEETQRDVPSDLFSCIGSFLQVLGKNTKLSMAVFTIMKNTHNIFRVIALPSAWMVYRHAARTADVSSYLEGHKRVRRRGDGMGRRKRRSKK